MEKEQIHSKLKSLVQKFEANKYHYLSKKYLEEEAKIDFINPFFEVLGWDVRNTKGLSPYEREVVVEKGETIGRPDYNFRIDGQTKFFVEAKAPHEPLHKINHVLQAKSYAWNTKSVFIVLLTDFEEFRLFDATIKPDTKNPDQGLIFELTYDQYLDNVDKLMLLSKEEVEKGSLDKLILKDPKSKKLRIPVDKAFLADLSQWREELAKDIYKRNIKELEDRSDEKRVKIQVKILNEAVQKILNRLIFIRITEDRKIIEPKSLLDQVEWWKAGGKRRDLHRRLTNCFMGWNQDFDGEILKPGPCDILEIDSQLLAKIIDSLYFPKCPYLFDVIGVELLGSIYERYLGKTIRVTPKRVKIKERPEVRKAGGVYYTPQYIVDYIVKNTVAKTIKGKTPKRIKKIKILDPACGSGSFLLTAFQTLIDYHLDYYEKHPEESGQGTLFPDVIVDYDGTKRLSIEKKAQILRNNIYGVDIDPQAVEIAMMSLYLKCLEGEKDLPRKKELLPSLAKNIRCGNSLISYDIFDQLTLFDEEEKERINPFDWHSKSTGFGEIMEKGGFDIVIGNPPYLKLTVTNLEKNVNQYYKKNYKSIHGGSSKNLFQLFIERMLTLNPKLFSFIVPEALLMTSSNRALRNLMVQKMLLKSILVFDNFVFQDAKIGSTIFVASNIKSNGKTIVEKIDKNGEEIELKRIKISECDNVWDTSSKDEFNDILRKMRKFSIMMQELVEMSKGMVVKNRKNFFEDSKTDDNLPFLLGNNIRRYSLTYTNYANYNNLTIVGGTKSFERHIQFPRLLIRRTGTIICACYSSKKELVESTLYILTSDKIDLKYLLGILNSKLLTFYLKQKLLTNIQGYPQILMWQLKQLPIRTCSINSPSEKVIHGKLVKLVDKMLELNKKKIALPPSSKRDKIEREIQITDEKINELVYELYGITEEEKKVIKEEND